MLKVGEWVEREREREWPWGRKLKKGSLHLCVSSAFVSIAVMVDAPYLKQRQDTQCEETRAY